MLRIRDTTGKTIEIGDKFRFVEICDLDGKIGKVFYCDDHNVIREVVAGSKEAERYAKMFKTPFVQVAQLH